jgi:hypothetical protein
MKLVSRLTQAAGANVEGYRVEIEINDPIELKDIDSVVAAVRSASPSAWVPIGKCARTRRIAIGQPQPPQFDDSNASQCFVGSITEPNAFVVARWHDDDTRAVRSVEQKRRQMADGVANMLVIDGTANDGFERWPTVLAPHELDRL